MTSQPTGASMPSPPYFVDVPPQDMRLQGKKSKASTILLGILVWGALLGCLLIIS
jgi:hypothetical protein